MLRRNRMVDIAEEVVDGVLEKLGAIEGENDLKRAFSLFRLISLLGCNRLNSLKADKGLVPEGGD